MTRRIASILVACLLLVADLLPHGPVRLWAFALLAGAPVALQFRRVWGLDLLLVTFVAGMFVWPLLRWLPVLGWASLAVLLRSRDNTRIQFAWRRADTIALVGMLATAVPIGLIWSANGMHGADYWARGWYERDTQWMWALAQESAARGGRPTENPWLAGLPNNYASLLHVGLGWLSTNAPGPAVLTCSGVVTAYMVAVAGLFVHALAERMGWLALVGWVAFEVVRPDVYPVSQSLAMGGLALLMWFAPLEPETWTRRTWLTLGGMVAFALLVYAAHPLVGCCALALVVTREWSWSIALLGGVAFQAIGLGMSQQQGDWFWLFNSPRWVHLALLLALPELAPRYVVGALLVALAAPPVITGQSLGLYTDAPKVADADLLRMFEWIRTSTPAESRFISGMHSMLLPGFTGRSQWPIEERGTYGRTGLTLAEFNARLYAIHAINESNSADLMRAWGYTHLLERGTRTLAGLHEAHREGEWVVLALDGAP